MVAMYLSLINALTNATSYDSIHTIAVYKEVRTTFSKYVSKVIIQSSIHFPVGSLEL